MANEIRIEMRPRNNLVLDRMEMLGINSVSELCRRSKTNETEVGALINFKILPFKRRNSKSDALGVPWKDCVIKIAEVLMCEPDDLFPEAIRHARIENGIQMHVGMNWEDLGRTLEAGSPPRALIASPTQNEILVEKSVKNVLGQMMDALPPRLKLILELRHGLHGNQEHNLQQIGEILGLTPERVRQLEARALRKLRHPILLQPLVKAGVYDFLKKNEMREG